MPTRISTLQLALSRSIWIFLLVLVVAGYALGLAPRFSELSRLCFGSSCPDGRLGAAALRSLHSLGLSLEIYAGYIVTLEAGRGLLFTLIGVVIMWRKPDDRMAQFSSTFLIVWGLVSGDIPKALGSWASISRAQVDALEGLFGWSLLLVFFYVFPNGHFLPRWLRPLPFIWVSWFTLAFLFPESRINPRTWPEFLQLLAFTVLLWVPGVSAQVYRYLRRSAAAERQQTKWIVLGLALAALLQGLSSLASLLLPNAPRIAVRMLAEAINTAALLLVPIAIGLAVLRLRLWDVDPLTNRVLTYTFLSTGLGLVYFGCVALLQGRLLALTGQRSQFTYVISTLAIAALFSPLRSRVQRFVDRSFYRAKYDAQRTLSAFSAAVRDEVDMERLAAELERVVRVTMQPQKLSLWLRAAPEKASKANRST